MAKRPLLSLAMMVKDEELFLEDALKSAAGWVDEMIVVDTGSTDRTVEIAKDMGATVSFFAWPNSFSLARNETLKRVTGEWVAVLDADERFKGTHPGRIRDFLVPGEAHPFEALMLNVVNTRLDGTPMSSFFSARIFPNDRRLGYSGRVHNQFGPLVPDAPKVSATRYLGLEVLHLGYDPAIYEARKKAARSLPLIEQTVREQPDNLQYRFYLGREYLLVGRIEEATRALESCVEAVLARGGGTPLLEAATCLFKCYDSEGLGGRSVQLAERVMALQPGHPDLLYGLARGASLRGESARCAAACEQALAALKTKVHEGQVELVHGPWQAEELLAGQLWKLGRYQESYAHYLAALKGKPADSMGWPIMLNSLAALSIELEDRERQPELLERLLQHPEAPLGMYFFAVQRRMSGGDVGGAQAMLREASARCPRMVQDPEFAPLASALGITCSGSASSA